MVQRSLLLPELNDGEIADGGGWLMVVFVSNLPLVVTVLLLVFVDSVTIGSARATPLMVKIIAIDIISFFIPSLSFNNKTKGMLSAYPYNDIRITKISTLTTIYKNKKEGE